MKLHTSHAREVKDILDSIYIYDEYNLFGGYNLGYKELKGYWHYKDVETEDYFNSPEYVWSEHLKQRAVFDVPLNNKVEKEEFFKAFGQKPNALKYMHYKVEDNPLSSYEYQYTHDVQPKYPIYVISKGRWKNTYTIDTLEEMGVNFYICVEPSEYELYVANPKIDSKKILVMPEDFSKQGNGAVPVRNWVWEHSVQLGYPKHWQLDDNIAGFFRYNHNLQKRVKNGVFFRIMEDYSDKFENLGLVGCQYQSFLPQILTKSPPIIINTRIYSTILINTELLDQRLEQRWRGRYNDDTDLTLRVLSTGDLCTANFQSLASGKITSGRSKGGMREIYDNHQHSGYKKKFDALKETWGKIVTLTYKKHADGRPHHCIEYTKLFKHKLKLKDGVSREPKINNYNMIFTDARI
jgi:hypothetical protein